MSREELKNYLITGADFRNKGGQSMLYITISELRDRFPGCRIFLPGRGGFDPNVKLTPVYADYGTLHYLHGGPGKAEAFGKACAKRLLRKQGTPGQIRELGELFPKLDAMIDISGFNLSSSWSREINFKYLEYIRQAERFGVPVYLMPQSFGPFDYGKDRAKMDADIRALLSGCRAVFAREQEGYDLLTGKYALTNVSLSPDLVLQNRAVRPENVFVKEPEYDLPAVEEGSVGIVPNLRSVEHGDKEKLLTAYREIIKTLLELGKTVYLLRHATEDLQVCAWIKELFPEEKNVILLEEDFDCLAYTRLAAQFDFVISSRFHGIVHALKAGTPCIALGWAVKYQELLSLFGMQEYVFHVGSSLGAGEVCEAVRRMDAGREAYTRQIAEKLEAIREQNCFDVLGREELPDRVDIKTVRTGLCCSCGICAGACPKDCITLAKSASGQMLPVIDEDACIRCGICTKVCPGASFELKEMSEKWCGAWNNDLQKGEIRAAYTGFAADPAVRAEAVSGGGVSALVRHLLAGGQYDRAFLVSDRTYGDAVLSRPFGPDDDLSCTPRSRYVTVSHEQTVRYLKEHREEKVIVVAVPCAVYGLLQAVSQFKLAREKLLFLGLVCDKTMTNRVNDYFEIRTGGVFDALDFRTKKETGWPGNVGVTRNGKTDFYPASLRTRVKEYFQPERCLYCLDKLNRFADIAFGDDYTGSCEKEGGNLVFVYTGRGEEILSEAARGETAALILTGLPADTAVQAMKLSARAQNEDFIRCLEEETGLLFAPEVPPARHKAKKKAWRARLAKIEAGARYAEDPAAFEKEVEKPRKLLYKVKRKLHL